MGKIRIRFAKGFAAAAGFLLLVAADQLLKLWCADNLQPYESVTLIPGVLNLTYYENRGAAFGMLQDGRWFFVGLGIAVVAMLLWWIVADKQHAADALSLTALTLILSGTVGNLADRLLQGYVVDMFEFEFVRFAIFNVADVALTCGGVLFCGYLLILESRSKAVSESGGDSAEEKT